MGEIADMLLEGLLDEETGELIDGEAPGYPRRMSQMHSSTDKPARTEAQRAAERAKKRRKRRRRQARAAAEGRS